MDDIVGVLENASSKNKPIVVIANEVEGQHWQQWLISKTDFKMFNIKSSWLW